MFASTTADWITAIGSAFAAVGTVGAVIVALWQTRRRDAYKVHVVCNIGLTGDKEIGNLVSLQATNTGERMVKLTNAYLQIDDGRQVFCKFFEPQRPGGLISTLPYAPLPASLVDGESLTIYWQQSSLDEIKQREGFSNYLNAFFTDPLGSIYAAPFPGVKAKRTGVLWRRRTYVPTQQSRS